MIKVFAIIGLMLLLCSPVFADDENSGPVYVNGYSRQDGTYVAPHFRTSPDEYTSNNYNYNPPPISQPVGSGTSSVRHIRANEWKMMYDD